MDLTEAAWNAVMNSIGGRLRALEAVQADFEALIALGTGQALASIAANVEPELTAARAALAQLQADTAAAEDAVAAILAGNVPMASVTGLAAALAALDATVAGKAGVADVTAAIDALVGAAPTTLDTIAELAAALGDDANLAATVAAALALRLRVDVDQGLDATAKSRGRSNLGLGSAAVLDAGLAAGNLVQLAAGGMLPAGLSALSRVWESAEQTITSAGGLTLAHPLGVVPKLYTAVLKCITAEAGFSAGDLLQYPLGPSYNDANGVIIRGDASSVYVRFGAYTTGLLPTLRPDTGAGIVSLTQAHWRLIVRAYA